VLVAEVALGAILLGTLVLAGLKALNPKRDLSYYTRRFTSWWMMGIVFCLALKWPGVALVFVAAISFLAIREYFTVINTRPEDRRALLWVYSSIPFQYLWIHLETYGMFVIFIPVCMLLMIPMRMVFRGKPEGVVGSIGRVHWGMMLFIFGVSHLAYFSYLKQREPGALLLFLLILTEVGDVAQFLLARLTKRGSIVPELGARRTWLGFVGSTMICAGLGFGLRFLTPFNPLDASLIGAGIAVAAFAGSIVVTAIRRDVEAAARDTRIIDHIDSHCYTAPLFFHLVYLLQP
jgi:phosphatidate cytidylyltransferase